MSNLHDYMDVTMDRLELEIEGIKDEIDNIQVYYLSNERPADGTGLYDLTHEQHCKAHDKKLDDGTLTYTDMALVKFYQALKQTDRAELKASLFSLSALLMVWIMELESETEPLWDWG